MFGAIAAWVAFSPFAAAIDSPYSLDLTRIPGFTNETIRMTGRIRIQPEGSDVKYTITAGVLEEREKVSSLKGLSGRLEMTLPKAYGKIPSTPPSMLKWSSFRQDEEAMRLAEGLGAVVAKLHATVATLPDRLEEGQKLTVNHDTSFTKLTVEAIFTRPGSGMFSCLRMDGEKMESGKIIVSSRSGWASEVEGWLEEGGHFAFTLHSPENRI